jgi:hypothetical protein
VSPGAGMQWTIAQQPLLANTDVTAPVSAAGRDQFRRELSADDECGHRRS